LLCEDTVLGVCWALELGLGLVDTVAFLDSAEVLGVVVGSLCNKLLLDEIAVVT
jgi:hypothetical protein